MKKTKILSLLLVLLGLALVTGCTPNTDTPEVPEEKNYTVTIASGIENGTVSTDKTSAKAGETVKLTVTPNDGYQLGSLTVVDSSSNAITTTSDTFTMPESNVTVDATFTKTAETLNREAADAVIAKINAIGEVSYTPESKEKIDDARSAYDVLTAEQKALVTNYSTLTTAESTYTSLIPPTPTETEPETNEPEETPTDEHTEESSPGDTEEPSEEELEQEEQPEEPENTTETSEGTNEESENDDQNTENSESEVIIPAGTRINLWFDTGEVEPDLLSGLYGMLKDYNCSYYNENAISNGLKLDDIKFLGMDKNSNLIFSNDNKNLEWYYSLDMDDISIDENLVTLKYYYQEENN